MSTPLPISSGIKRQSGFALVIALSLMAFVLLLLLSITSFVGVEQQSANIAKQQLSARQNALAGLQVAMGELQVRVGPISVPPPVLTFLMRITIPTHLFGTPIPIKCGTALPAIG